jgi:hypothetical protein
VVAVSAAGAAAFGSGAGVVCAKAAVAVAMRSPARIRLFIVTSHCPRRLEAGAYGANCAEEAEIDQAIA